MHQPLIGALLGAGLLASCGSLGSDRDGGDGASDGGADIGDGGIDSGFDANLSCPSGMIAWWKGDNNASDELKAIPLTSIGTVGYAPGKVNNGFAIDAGLAVYLSGNPSPALNNVPALSIEGWVSGLNGSTPIGVILWDGNANLSAGFSFAMGKQGDAGVVDGLGFVLASAYGADTYAWPFPKVDWTQPQHLAVTYEPVYGAKFYVNGTRMKHSETTTPTPIGDGTTLYVGRWFFGTIDELAVYKIVLTEPQIQAIVAAGANGKCKT